MAFLATLRVTQNPFRKEAIHGSCYRVAPLPPSRATATATRPGPATPLRPPPRPASGRGSPPRREGLLPRAPLFPLRYPVGLPLPSPRPRPLLPPSRRTLRGLAGCPAPAPLLGRHRRLLQGPAAPARGGVGPADPGHGPAGPGPSPARLALGGAHGQG